MNNLFVLGKRIQVDASTVDYTVMDGHFLNACTVADQGAWADESTLPSLDQAAELRMMALLSNFHSSPTVAAPALGENEQYCLFFQAPLDGKITVVQRNGEYLLLYLPTDAREHLEFEVQIGSLKGVAALGNTIVIGRKAGTGHFSSDHVRVVTIEALVNHLMQRKPDRINRTGRSYVFSGREVNGLPDLRRRPDERRRHARALAAQAVSNATLGDFLNLPVSNTQLPVKAGAAIPLFSFGSISDLNSTNLACSIALGVSLVPYHDRSFHFGESWTWFEPTALLRRLPFEPAWGLSGTMVADSPVLGWSGYTSLEDILIARFGNLNLRIFNPVQSSDEATPILLDYFVASPHQPIETAASETSQWFQRDYWTPSRTRPTAAFSPAPPSGGASREMRFNVDTQSDLLQIKASAGGRQANVTTVKLARNLRESDTIFEHFIRDFATQPICTTPTADLPQRGDQIHNWFREKTGYANFIDWFHRSVNTIRYAENNWYGNYFYRGHNRPSRAIGNDVDARRNFIEIWNRVPLMFNAESINIFQFFSLVNIFINESSRLRPIPEVGSLKRFFENKGKQSYNKGPNLKAGELFFNNASFWEAHSASDTTPSVRTGTDRNESLRRWNSETQYPNPPNPTNLRPAPTFPNPNQSANTPIGELDNIAGIIAQADFCKFRGRGLIQTTWRTAYLRLIEFIMNYTGSSPKVHEIKGIWSRFPSTTVEEIATRSTNRQWDELFMESDYEVPCKAVFIFQQSKSNFLTTIGASNLDLLFGRGAGSIFRVGHYVGGSEGYGEVVLNRTKQMMKALVLDYRRTHSEV